MCLHDIQPASDIFKIIGKELNPPTPFGNLFSLFERFSFFIYTYKKKKKIPASPHIPLISTPY